MRQRGHNQCAIFFCPNLWCRIFSGFLLPLEIKSQLHVHSNNPWAQNMTRSNLHEWGILPQVVSILWRLPGHRLSFSTGNASISDHQQNSLRQKQLKRRPKRNNPRATILKDNVSSFGAVLSSFFSPPLLMTGTFAFNYPCRNLGHWSFPFCRLFRNPPFYANFHPVVIFEQPKDQNLPFLLTSSPVSRGLDVWNNNPMSNRWCYSVILCHDSDSASWCPSACSCQAAEKPRCAM